MLCTLQCKQLFSICRNRARTPLCFSTINTLDNHASLAPLLRWCARQKCLVGGQQAHHQVIKSDLKQNTLLGNLVMQVYCSCGALRDASALFSQMDQRRNEFTWRIMIVARVQHRHFKHAFRLFEEMICTGCTPDRLTFITIITACSYGGRLDLDRGKRAHYLIIVYKLNLDTVVENALITMYGKNDSLMDAQSMFDSMASRDVVSWNALIVVYASEGHIHEALYFFNRMEKDKMIPNNFTYLAILSAFTNPSALSDGIQVHNHILASKFKSDVAVNNALINMYGGCASLKGAEETFNIMPERNAISWTTMLAVYAEHGNGPEAFQLYKQMWQESMMPNIVTYVTFLDACIESEALATGKQVHSCLCGVPDKNEIIVDTALVNLYGKCGSVKMAREVFDGMLERSVVSWGTIISIFGQHALSKEALQTLQQMQQEGEVPDRVVFLSILDACANQALLKAGQQVFALVTSTRNHSDISLNTALLRLYCGCDNLIDAERIFFSMPDRSAFSWNALIAGYLQLEECKLTLFCFNRMQQESVLPDEVTFVTLFSACGVEMDLPSGKKIHALFWRSGFLLDVILWNSLISMYGRCGNLKDAQTVFARTPNSNTVTWNAVTAAHAQNGYTKESLRLFRKMELEGIKTEKATFAVILSACSHGGLVEEAFKFFDLMIKDHGIEPSVDHYNCMIDLLTRAGRMDEAEALLKKMPCKVNFVSLMTLLSACKVQTDIQRAEQITLHACHACPGNVAPLIELSKLYVAVETCEDSKAVLQSLHTVQPLD